MVTVCVRTSEDGTMHAVELPADVIPKLRTVLDRESSVSLSVGLRRSHSPPCRRLRAWRRLAARRS